MAPLPHRNLRHPWLRYQIEEYTEGIVHDFERRLETIWDRSVNRVHILDFEGLTPEMRRDLAVRLRMVYTGEDRKQMSDTKMGLDVADTLCFQLGGVRRRMAWSERIVPDKGDLRDYLIKISSDRDFLGSAPSYVHIKDPVRRLCHRMIACTISGRGHGPKKGRKSGARLSGGHFIGHLAEHFGLVSDEGLREGPPPPPPAPQPRTMSQRIKRIEEDMRDLQNDVVGLLGVVESFTTEKSRVSTWLISCMTQLMDASGHPYQAFDSTLEVAYWNALTRVFNPRTKEMPALSQPLMPMTSPTLVLFPL
ncbi:hypothetical protein Tco_0138486 [Tanacetum coccineum]